MRVLSLRAKGGGLRGAKRSRVKPAPAAVSRGSSHHVTACKRRGTLRALGRFSSRQRVTETPVNPAARAKVHLDLPRQTPVTCFAGFWLDFLRLRLQSRK